MTSAAPLQHSLTQLVAKRLRGVLAEERISGHELARMTGMGRMAINRRLLGETALNTDELEMLEEYAGIRAVYLLTGVEPKLGPKVGRVGLEPTTSGLVGRGSGELLPVTHIHEFGARKQARLFRSVAVSETGLAQ